jgi:hypothetical protein
VKRLIVLVAAASLLLAACDLVELFDLFEVEDITHADDPAVRAAAISDPEGRADIKAGEAIHTATETHDPADALEAERLRPGDSSYIAYTVVLSNFQGDSAGAQAAVDRLYDALFYDNPGEDHDTIRRLAYQQVLDAQLQIIQAEDEFPGREAMLDSYCYEATFGMRSRFGEIQPTAVQAYIDNHVAYWICH